MASDRRCINVESYGYLEVVVSTQKKNRKKITQYSPSVLHSALHCDNPPQTNNMRYACRMLNAD